MTIKRVSVVGGNEREETSDTLCIVTAQFNDNTSTVIKFRPSTLNIHSRSHTMFFSISM